VKKVLQALSLDANRSFLDKVKVYPLNLNVEATQTFNPKPATPPAGFPPQMIDLLPSPPSPTAVVHYSFVKLPDKPMMGRLVDTRVGYFTHSHIDYSLPTTRRSAAISSPAGDWKRKIPARPRAKR